MLKLLDVHYTAAYSDLHVQRHLWEAMLAAAATAAMTMTATTIAAAVTATVATLTQLLQMSLTVTMRKRLLVGLSLPQKVPQRSKKQLAVA